MLTAYKDPAQMCRPKETASYHVYFFGPFRILRAGQPIEHLIRRRSKAISLLKWFLLNPATFHSSEELLSLFWEGVPGKEAARNLRVSVHYLRHILEPDLPAGQSSTLLRYEREKGYLLTLNTVWWTDILDMHCCAQLAKRLEQNGETEQAIPLYHKVVEYCEQGFLPEDIYEEAFTSHRFQLECVQTQTLSKLVQLCQQRYRWQEVLMYAQQLLLCDPYSELAVGAIMNAHCSLGNTAGAFNKMRYFQQRLKNDLQMEPSREFLQLKDKLINL